MFDQIFNPFIVIYFVTVALGMVMYAYTIDKEVVDTDHWKWIRRDYPTGSIPAKYSTYISKPVDALNAGHKPEWVVMLFPGWNIIFVVLFFYVYISGRRCRNKLTSRLETRSR